MPIFGNFRFVNCSSSRIARACPRDKLVLSLCNSPPTHRSIVSSNMIIVGIAPAVWDPPIFFSPTNTRVFQLSSPPPISRRKTRSRIWYKYLANSYLQISYSACYAQLVIRNLFSSNNGIIIAPPETFFINIESHRSSHGSNFLSFFDLLIFQEIL